ncbi:DUF7710 domain-containing protein [Dyadobacter luticola]|uniref:DUF7710 domain-containing protein n=1 Tax=Dyadobacter luticola TaxID=1979387 RepID=A0A5R9L4W4_9BACT|nr:hypothetical protein [Dyadobacter luticola]TLV03583.1 hypothetical protein FEN17_08260 [Dyadobacter luticola]
MDIWVFHGIAAQFASGIFSSKQKAEEWILENKLSGILTWYPIDTGVYDWALANEFFEIKKPEQRSSGFIQRFTSGSQMHFHYENGLLD